MYIGFSFDGGGAMGYLTALFMRHLSKELGLQVYQMADELAGTSIGGVLAIAYAINHHTHDKIVGIFEEDAEDVFSKNPLSYLGIPVTSKYVGSGLIEVMEKYFECYQMKHCLIPTTVMAREYNVGNWYISSENSKFMNLGADKAAIATASAPHYFPAYNHGDSSLLDGGLFAPNPSTYLISKALNKGVPIQDIWVISVGTGFSKEAKKKITNPNVFKTIGIAIDEYGDAILDYTDTLNKNMLKERYIRIDVEVPPMVNKMDGIEYLSVWKQYAQSMIDLNGEAIRKIKEITQHKKQIFSS